MRTDCLAWIRRNVPIGQVAGALGLVVSRNAARCWRRSNHANGDEHPSISFTSQNRYRCFVCDRRPGSNVDLVMRLLGIDLPSAIRWFRQHYSSIPDEAPRRREPDLKRVTLESIIASGVWATQLTDAERNILAVLWHERDSKTGSFSLSYRGAMKIAGIGGLSTVATAVRKFEALHLLEIQRKERRKNVYHFIEHADFVDLQHQTWETFKPGRTVSATDTDRDDLDEQSLSATDKACHPDSNLCHPQEYSSAAPLHRYLTPATDTDSHRDKVLSDTEQQILRLAKRGFLIFPCRVRTKTPLVSNWQKLATADTAKIVRWFKQLPGCNWAIRTGPASKLFVLDIDGEVGLATLHRLMAEHKNEPQPDTLSVKTARGWQMYFAHPVGVNIPNSVGRIGKGLDIRGGGGLVMAVGSVHPDGPVYAWLGEDGENKPVASPPRWLLAAIEQASAADSTPAREREGGTQTEGAA